MWVSAAALAARRESLTTSEARRKLYWVLGVVRNASRVERAERPEGEARNTNWKLALPFLSSI